MKARSISKKTQAAGLIAVDTGGTFTDFYYILGQKVQTHKVLSTPQDPSKAILRGLQELGFDQGELIHGSTVATNALLERKGARVALVTTSGFEDIIEIGRQNRDSLYDIFVERSEPLVKTGDRFGISERLDANGKVLKVLSATELKKLCRQLQKSRVQSIAICLLNSYTDGRHEQAIAKSLQKLGKPLSLSSLICPEFREYERSTTTCANAYLAPIMSRYLTRLQQQLTIPIRVMQSNGGSLTIDEAAEQSVRTLLSGPAGGALGALRCGKASGFDKLISFDMGGTSTDLTLLDGKIELSSEAQLSAVPIKIPMIRIHTIGAGGGSIARVDAGGALQVGPESAGAKPGPICYGQKGTQCTITDAHLFLGRIHPDYFLGGTMKLHPQKVAGPLQRLAKQMKLTAEATADGILQVANANMARALRVISLERGYDARHFTLVAFGGAGGLHACELADNLKIPRVLVPTSPGILSAYGMAYADWIRDYVHTLLMPDQSRLWSYLSREIRLLKTQARRDAQQSGHVPRELHFTAELDVRYQGQSYELRVPLTKNYARAFVQAHRKRFAYTHSKPLEIVNVRLQARIAYKHREPRTAWQQNRKKRLEPVGHSKLFWRDRTWKLNCYQRDHLVRGDRIKGPAIIAEYSATTFVPPGWKATCTNNGTLILTQANRWHHKK